MCAWHLGGFGPVAIDGAVGCEPAPVPRRGLHRRALLDGLPPELPAVEPRGLSAPPTGHAFERSSEKTAMVDYTESAVESGSQDGRAISMFRLRGATAPLGRRRRWLTGLFTVLAMLVQGLLLAPAAGAEPPADFQTSLVIGGGLDGPSGFEIAPDGRIFVLERAGKVKIVKNGELLPTPFAVAITSPGRCERRCRR